MSSSSDSSSSESFSSSSSSYEPEMESLSTWSSGSQSESSDSLNGTESSESSENVVWYSQAIVQPIRRNLQRVNAQILIDLNLVDIRYVDLLGPQELEVGFEYQGTYYSADSVVLEDGARPTLILSPRQPPKTEDAILDAWIREMINRIRRTLNFARAEGEAYFDISPAEYRIL